MVNHNLAVVEALPTGLEEAHRNDLVAMGLGEERHSDLAVAVEDTVRIQVLAAERHSLAVVLLDNTDCS